MQLSPGDCRRGFQGKHMIRFVAAFVLALCATSAFAEEVVPLSIGGTEVQVLLPDGYLRASQDAPAMFAATATTLPPSIRLVEVLLAESDVKRLMLGQDATLPYQQVQVMRDAEALDFSETEWRAMQPVLAAQMGALDLDATAKSMQSEMGKNIGKATGGSADIQFGEIGKPRVYSQAGGVIRYSMRLPISGTVNGRKVDMLLDCAGAMLVLKKKLVLFNTYLHADDHADSGARIRAYLETAVTRAQALNAADAGQPAGGKAPLPSDRPVARAR